MPEQREKRKERRACGRGHVLVPALITLLLVLALLGGIAFHSIVEGENSYELSFYQLVSDRVRQNLRFVFLSDLHLREYGADNVILASDVEALQPDVILLGGDLVTYGAQDYENMLSLCRSLAKIAPTYGVMGNHEDELVYLSGDHQLVQRFTDAGVHVLCNETASLEINGDAIELVGISGNGEGYARYGGRDCMEGLDADSPAFRVVMAHIPTLFDDHLQNYAFDMGVAGHTHGGMVRLPRFGGLYTAEEGFLPTYDGGSYILENGATLFVSRGLGASGKLPRIFNPPELVVIDVNWY